MRIGVAQTRPIKGDIQSNIHKHKKLIDIATSDSPEILIFPELSLTGYEPELAKELATDKDDSRFDVFQKISDAKKVTIGVGVPTKGADLPCISLLLFQPHRSRQAYSKQYLHADEEGFFRGGKKQSGQIGEKGTIALAICYELSVPEHAERAHGNGAEIYIASVAKTAKGVASATERLAEIARRYSMTALMSNCIGQSGGYECAGNSAIWSKDGSVLAQLDGANEGVLIIDTETQLAVSITV